MDAADVNMHYDYKFTPLTLKRNADV